MAAKSFLNADDLLIAEQKLTAPHGYVPDGDETRAGEFSSLEFSQWLGERLLARLKSYPEFDQSGAIILGSWARGELSLKSDFDMLFCGDESAVSKVKDRAAQDGLKLRYRMPENPDDWTIGVEPFDVLSLMTAVALTEDANHQLKIQQDLLARKSAQFRKQLVRAMTTERKLRSERYDSISSFLEPNLKYGPGGLRDLEQALVIRRLFPARFGPESEHAFQVLSYYKRFFLLVRQKLHLSEGASDLLTAPEQRPISDWLHFKSPRDFMREIQKGLSRVSFYADWVIEQATRPKARVEKVNRAKLESITALFSMLDKDPSALMQNRVRLAADQVFHHARKSGKSGALDRMIGKRLRHMIEPARAEGPMVALFRSRLIDHCVPEFRRIIGHVQHDQYHRFTVDAHILQALRELKRLHKNPKISGRLGKVVSSLKNKEWETLAFACLYHDIAKGRDGDHSIEGVKIVRHDLARFAVEESIIDDVAWIVEEHLALSAAAFRQNPHSPRVWRELDQKGVQGRRLTMLAAFTYVDIRATNPEAWTAWKERLLFDLVTQLEKPEASSMIRFAIALKSNGFSDHWLDSLDPFLIASLPSQKLIDDLQALHAPLLSGDLEPAVISLKRAGQTWIRFHSRVDRAGLFLQFVARLVAAGLGIRHASIHTDPVLGVYDWFEVKTTRTPQQIRKLLSYETPQPSNTKKSRGAVRVGFDSIEIVSSDAKEWVISFRGRDQSGALLGAAQALFEEGADIKWAKVHTWGRQIDDVFGIASSPTSPEDLLVRLRNRLR